ncbi:MAG TPA: Rrf2 family transcriptional regulator [Tissierellia bacterium]|nr:Rrf2 family transcriptional regulator [Tissierellia bacterium]
MKLSTRGRYGLKAMFQLALHYGKGPIPLNVIASQQDLSENYLEQLFSALRKEGLIKSVRGAQGGYMLAKPPEKITVGSVLRVLEGNMAPVECVIDDTVSCDKEESCVTKLVWMKIKDSINSVIDSITLQDMLNEQKNLGK